MQCAKAFVLPQMKQTVRLPHLCPHHSFTPGWLHLANELLFVLGLCCEMESRRVNLGLPG